ncbi:TonB-dependent receptor [Sediminitomix flava]|nr:TonB-dependent receptor [Sediminitomix flava]
MLLILGLSTSILKADDVEQFTLDYDNETLEVVMGKVESMSSYRFFYNPDDVNLNQKVSVQTYKASIQKVLNSIFLKTSISYSLKGKQIALYTKTKSSSIEQEEQKQTIRGVVYDEVGQPMPGVNVMEVGTENGTITNFNGEYVILVSAQTETLKFSFIGYASKIEPINSRTKIDITLKEDVSQLDEVVVVGYGVQEKVNVTGSVAAVKGSEIAEVPATTVTNSLAGRLSGVIVTNESGEPGNDGASIKIRGFDNPLVIVDGVEMDFSRIDPNDIENISVLKDASAAIYGARAGNGVVLVTTKRGKEGRMQVNLNTSYGAQSSTIIPEYVNALQYMELVNDYAPNTYTEADFNEFRDGTRQSTDWYAETFRDSAPIFKSNVNVRGGTENVQYFVSYGFMDQASVLRSDDTNYGQHNVRSNLNIGLTESIDLRVDVAHRIENREYPGANMEEIMTNVAFSNPMFPATYPDPSYPVYNGFQIGPNYISQRDISGYTESTYTNSSINAALEYKAPFLDGLSAKAFMNYNSWNTRSKDWRSNYSYFYYDETSERYSEVEMKDESGIFLNEGYERGERVTAQFSLRFEREFGKHRVNALLLNEVITSQGDFVSAGRQAFISSAVEQMFASSADKQYTEGWAWQDGRIGLVGRLNYKYDDRYMVEFTFRNDGSNKFAEDQRWGFFPSASVGWRISEEAFLKDVDAIQNIKLRASYGQLGYDNIGNYNFLTGYQFSSAYIIDGTATTGINSKGLANPLATWETMTIANLGLDMEFFDGKIWTEFDVFQRRREGMLAKRVKSLPTTFGAELPEENINSQIAKGFELVIGHDNTIADVRYSISGNVSLARAEWDHYDEPVYADEETRARYQQSGQLVNRYFGYEALGLFTSQEEIDSWVDQDGDPNNGINHDLQPGDIKYKDLNGDGLINDLDKSAIGKGSIPEIFYGLNMSVSYKGFDFTMLWQGASGHNVAFQAEAQQAFYNSATPLAMFMERWTPENNDPNARFPRTVSNAGSANNYRESSFWLQDASYFRLKNVSLGYTVPMKFSTKLGMEKVRLGLSGFNLFTFTDVYPYDPETPNGGRGWNYPQQKTIMANLNISF